MTIVNVGAWVNDQRPASKAALKAALANGERVLFDSASPIFGPRAGETITPDSIGEDTLSVAGPDPRTNPRWWATVQVSRRTGKVTVA